MGLWKWHLLPDSLQMNHLIKNTMNGSNGEKHTRSNSRPFFRPQKTEKDFHNWKKKNDYANNYLQGKHFWSVHYPFEIMTKYCSLSGISQQKCSPNCTMNMFSVLFISYCLFYQTPWTQNEDTRKEHGADAHTKSKHVVNDNWSRSQANWCHSLGRAPLRNTLHELLQSVLNHAE